MSDRQWGCFNHVSKRVRERVYCHSDPEADMLAITACIVGIASQCFGLSAEGHHSHVASNWCSIRALINQSINQPTINQTDRQSDRQTIRQTDNQSDKQLVD